MAKRINVERVTLANQLWSILQAFPDVSAEWLMRGKGRGLIDTKKAANPHGGRSNEKN